jgi:hypothetical protein
MGQDAEGRLKQETRRVCVSIERSMHIDAWSSTIAMYTPYTTPHHTSDKHLNCVFQSHQKGIFSRGTYTEQTRPRTGRLLTASKAGEP